MQHFLAFFAVTLVGVTLRLLYGLEIHPASQSAFSDMKANLVNAHQIYKGLESPVVATRHGLYTFLLSPFYHLEHPLQSMNLLMVLLSCARLLTIGWLCRQMLAPAAALALYALQAINPLEIDAGAWLLDTSLYGTLLLLLVGMWWRWSLVGSSRGPLWGVAIGTVAALTLLTRENLLPALPLGLLWMLRVRGRAALRDALFLVLALVITTSPMLARNLRLTGHPYLVTSRGPYNLYYFNSGVKLVRIENSRQSLRVMSPLFQLNRFAPWYDLRRLAPLPFRQQEEVHRVETEDGAYWKSRFWGGQTPGRLLTKGLHLAYLFLVPPWPGAWEASLAPWLYPSNLLFCLLVAAGVLARIRRPRLDRADWLLLVFLSGLLVATWITFGEARYRTPYDPLWLIFALRSWFAVEGRGLGAEKEEVHE